MTFCHTPHSHMTSMNEIQGQNNILFFLIIGTSIPAFVTAKSGYKYMMKFVVFLGSNP